MKLRYFLVAIIAAIFPIVALTSCKDDSANAADAKFQYAVAMTGVV